MVIAVTSFEATNSVFNITSENNGFSIRIPGDRKSEDGEELSNKLDKLLELKSENYTEFYVEEVEKRCTRRNRKYWL